MFTGDFRIELHNAGLFSQSLVEDASAGSVHSITQVTWGRTRPCRCNQPAHTATHVSSSNEPCTVELDASDMHTAHMRE
eukprot:6179522-Pleurochrysis_carterae.AAC.3